MATVPALYQSPPGDALSLSARRLLSCPVRSIFKPRLGEMLCASSGSKGTALDAFL
jgi:hypothetical protein